MKQKFIIISFRLVYEKWCENGLEPEKYSILARKAPGKPTKVAPAPAQQPTSTTAEKVKRFHQNMEIPILIDKSCAASFEQWVWVRISAIILWDPSICLIGLIPTYWISGNYFEGSCPIFQILSSKCDKSVWNYFIPFGEVELIGHHCWMDGIICFNRLQCIRFLIRLELPRSNRILWRLKAWLLVSVLHQQLL